MSTLIFNVYMQEVMKEMKLEIRRKGSEWWSEEIRRVVGRKNVS